jgi:hypothetical protein
MSAFFLSLSQLFLYRAWCVLVNGAKETGTHLTDTREREESLKHLKSNYAKYLKHLKSNYAKYL